MTSNLTRCLATDNNKCMFSNDWPKLTHISPHDVNSIAAVIKKKQCHQHCEDNDNLISCRHIRLRALKMHKITGEAKVEIFCVDVKFNKGNISKQELCSDFYPIIHNCLIIITYICIISILQRSFFIVLFTFTSVILVDVLIIRVSLYNNVNKYQVKGKLTNMEDMLLSSLFIMPGNNEIKLSLLVLHRHVTALLLWSCSSDLFRQHHNRYLL